MPRGRSLWLNPFGRSNDDFTSKRFYTQETQQSNYFLLTISDDPVKHEWSPTRDCPLNYHFCEAIEKSDWNSVERLISKQTDYNNKLGMNFTDNNWLHLIEMSLGSTKVQMRF
ncbi:hypothetical protein OAJ52_05330 [Bacteroidia bacterium]|jgi:hypothetical protein|nr:hypothetical protein [Bacteroidia bacterium]